MGTDTREKWIPAVIFFAFAIGAPAGEGNAQKNAKGPKEFAITVEKINETVKITATGRSGFHCNTLYPWKLTVEKKNNPPKVYKKQDARWFTQQKVVFEFPSSVGKRATLKLSVCNDVQCIMHEEKLFW